MAQNDTAMTDAQTETKSLRNLGGRRGDAVIRSYSADGHLYAYREGDTHVVVSNGREPATRWTKRFHAERTDADIDVGETLWTVPDNWVREIEIERVNGGAHVIYTVPETGAVVRVSTPKNNHLVDAWYGVKAVGETIEFELRDEPDADALDAAIERQEELLEPTDDPHFERVVNALRELRKDFDTLNTAYREYVDESIDFLMDDWEPEWDSLPADDHRFEHVWGPEYGVLMDDLLGYQLGIDEEIVRDVGDALVSEGTLARDPAFTPRVR
jgi:hypothetical protein